MQRMIFAAFAAFGLALLIGPFAIRAMRRLKFGQNVYDLAPETHQKKQGTPTMGGFIFALAALPTAFLFRPGAPVLLGDKVLALLLFALANLGIGFLDDYKKIRAKHNQGGLSEKQKLAMQFAVAALFSAYCCFHADIGTAIAIPFFGVRWVMPWWLYIPAMVFVIICTTNGANLLDGLDGLLGSVSAGVTAFFAVAALLLAQTFEGAAAEDAYGVGVACAAVCGALLGFLCFNLYPARIIMGDTGSMFLGGMTVGAAMLLGQPLIVPIAAGAYAASLLSVFLQRMYFKATHGKRIFKMSPLHHHFELSGVPETRIVSLYAIATVLLCLLAFIGLRG